MNTNAYRSDKKRRLLGFDLTLDRSIPKITAKEQRATRLHIINGNKTWVVDYFFLRPDGSIIDGQFEKTTAINSMLKDDANTQDYVMYRDKPMFIIMCFMHCNSRFVDYHICKSRKAEEYVTKLLDLIAKYPAKFGTIISDKEGAFSSRVAIEIYRANNIKHVCYNMKADLHNHSRLALIDRFARTLRDMIFNCKRADSTWELNRDTLKQLIATYNLTPHDTLSSIMKFSVSPYEAFKHIDLLNEIDRRIYAANFMTATSDKFDSIEVGDIVWLHKPKKFGEKRRLNVEDEPYVVTRVLMGGYYLSDLDGNPLTRIVYINNKPEQVNWEVPRSELTIKR